MPLSKSRSKDAVEGFEEYDPTPYSGGYDQTLTYGRPIPSSGETCHPISTSGDMVGDRYGLPRPRPQADSNRWVEAPHEWEEANRYGDEGYGKQSYQESGYGYQKKDDRYGAEGYGDQGYVGGNALKFGKESYGAGEPRMSTMFQGSFMRSGKEGYGNPSSAGGDAGGFGMPGFGGGDYRRSDEKGFGNQSDVGGGDGFDFGKESYGGGEHRRSEEVRLGKTMMFEVKGYENRGEVVGFGKDGEYRRSEKEGFGKQSYGESEEEGYGGGDGGYKRNEQYGFGGRMGFGRPSVGGDEGGNEGYKKSSYGGEEDGSGYGKPGRYGGEESKYVRSVWLLLISLLFG